MKGVLPGGQPTLLLHCPVHVAIVRDGLVLRGELLATVEAGVVHAVLLQDGLPVVLQAVVRVHLLPGGQPRHEGAPREVAPVDV